MPLLWIDGLMDGFIDSYSFCFVSLSPLVPGVEIRLQTAAAKATGIASASSGIEKIAIIKEEGRELYRHPNPYAAATPCLLMLVLQYLSPLLPRS